LKCLFNLRIGYGTESLTSPDYSHNKAPVHAFHLRKSAFHRVETTACVNSADKEGRVE